MKNKLVFLLVFMIGCMACQTIPPVDYSERIKGRWDTESLQTPDINFSQVNVRADEPKADEGIFLDYTRGNVDTIAQYAVLEDSVYLEFSKHAPALSTIFPDGLYGRSSNRDFREDDLFIEFIHPSGAHVLFTR